MINKKLTPEQLIEKIRDSFVGAEQVYMNGSCTALCLILKSVFPNAKGYWSKEAKHMITKIGNKYYDIRGEVVKPDSSYELDDTVYGSLKIAIAFPKSTFTVKRFANAFKFS